MYEVADAKQVERLSKYVKCTKWKKPQIVECDKYFANFNMDQFEYVRANEYYFCIHANFNAIGYNPDITKLGNKVKYIGVSQFACDKFLDFKHKDARLCYNPLTLEPKERVMHLVSACRLNDKVKGGERTKRLIKALDNYCELNDRHYVWTIFTNDVNTNIESKNVAIMPPRLDVRPYIQDADYVLQLSNDMETYCYTLNEAWCYGVHTISTPLSVIKEFDLPPQANMILDWECENVNEIARRIFEDELIPFEYQPPQDDWDNLLSHSPSQYRREMNMQFRVKAIKWNANLTDNQVGRPREVNEKWIVDKARLDKLMACNQISLEVVETIEDAIQQPKEIKKAVKKSTRKKSE